MHEYIDRRAISSLATHDDVEMRHTRAAATWSKSPLNDCMSD